VARPATGGASAFPCAWPEPAEAGRGFALCWVPFPEALCRRDALIIPPHLLEADTLTRLLEDFVTRDGTDNGDDTPLHIRVQRVQRALDRGEAVIVFDPLSEQCQLMLKRDVPPELLDAAAPE
jgi:uncharacterized protein YheU (UPF0270 family)